MSKRHSDVYYTFDGLKVFLIHLDVYNKTDAPLLTVPCINSATIRQFGKAAHYSSLHLVC